MKKAIFQSEMVTGSEIVTLQNVTSVTISNLSMTETKFRLKSIERFLPGKDPIYNVPVAPFMISSENHSFDLELSFPDENTLIVIDYFQLIVPKTDCT